MEDAGDRLRVILRPSRILILARSAAYLGAAICLLSLDLGSGIKGVMLAFLILSGFCDSFFQACGKRLRRVMEIIFEPEGDWRIVNAAGEVLRGRPVPGRLVHPLAVCFSIRLANAKRLPVVIVGDMCSDESFRRLRAWLRVHAEEGADNIPPTGRFRDRSGRADGRP